MLKLMRQEKSYVAALVMLLCVVSASAQNKRLSKVEAVRLAEQFIAQNGYTDLPPNKDRTTFESIEWESNVEKMLKGRYDTLERKAYGVVSGRKAGSRGWTVVFRYKHPETGQMRRNGRAVTMNLDGSEIRVEHVDFILRYVERKR